MSDRYPGGFITKDTPVTTQSSAPGVWTLDQAMQATRGGNWPVNGPFFIEDVFSTWLYTGNSSTQTITNGIDLAGKGGLVWFKRRDGAGDDSLFDTARGATKYLRAQATSAEATNATSLTSFNADGFSLGNNGLNNFIGETFASWTFREQPKFFDVVTYTGNGVSGRQIAHNLGSVPGCIIVKRLNAVDSWPVYHRAIDASAPQDYFFMLNSTAARALNTTWANTAPTETVFSVSDLSRVNASGGTYVAYLFAHNAGGFGLTGTDNVISCGSFTTDGSGLASVTLGYEPQWIMTKRSSGTSNWIINDVMRGMPVPASASGAATLNANLSDAETIAGITSPTATGFDVGSSASSTFIYIAIRRGPMKVPTTGTSVFTPVTQASFNAYSVGFPTDLAMGAIRGGNAINTAFGDRLRGGTQYLVSSSTAAEANDPGGLFYFDLQNSMDQGLSSSSSAFWNFRRAPGFFDEVCYTGTGSVQNVSHNLTVIPELIIVKKRNSSSNSNWATYAAPIGNTKYLFVNTTAAEATFTFWNNTNPTSTQWTMDGSDNTNSASNTYVAYLFASCPGVSKVGSYTGTGATQVINCGFTAGARFVLIKSTSTTGNWLVWDSARGIVAGNDPYLALNSAAAEVTTTDWVDTAATGFELSNAGGNLANSNGVSYIFLAIA
jgi:hypothetical protein